MRRNDDQFPMRRGGERGLSPSSDPQSLAPSDFFTGSPWQMMRRMQEDMDRLFGQLLGGTGGGAFGGGGMLPGIGGQQWMPSVDVSQTEREWCIEADLPGVDKEDIDVQVHQGRLVLRAELRQGRGDCGPDEDAAKVGAQQSGASSPRQYQRRERRYGFFERVLPLPENADDEHIRCDFKNGVLSIHIPKQEQAAFHGRRIPIEDGSTGGMPHVGAGSMGAHRSGELGGTTAPPVSQATAGTNGARGLAGAKGGETPGGGKQSKKTTGATESTS